MQTTRKTLWLCYACTLALILFIYIWGATGILGGGTHAYRLFSFYGAIPTALFVIGCVLGYKNARFKWLYPVMFGFLVRLVVVQFVNLQVGLPFFHFMFAAGGVALGTVGRLVAQHFSMQQVLNTSVRVVVAVSCVVALIHVIHAATLDRRMQYVQISFSSPHITAELHGYTIAFVTDTHHISARRLQGIVDELNNMEIDMLVLGGDFSSRVHHMQESVAILAQTVTTDGVFGVEGNHDTYSFLFLAMRDYGITPLSNSGYRIRDNLFLAGVEDLWNRNPSVACAIQHAAADDFVLLISHNPDVAMQQCTVGVDLILSGHTHAGQITFFGLWAPYLTFRSTITNYGHRFRTGWAYSRDGTPVFVSNGVGEYLPRVFARPQVVVVTLISD